MTKSPSPFWYLYPHHTLHQHPRNCSSYQNTLGPSGSHRQFSGPSCAPSSRRTESNGHPKLCASSMGWKVPKRNVEGGTKNSCLRRLRGRWSGRRPKNQKLCQDLMTHPVCKKIPHSPTQPTLDSNPRWSSQRGWRYSRQNRSWTARALSLEGRAGSHLLIR